MTLQRQLFPTRRPPCFEALPATPKHLAGTAEVTARHSNVPSNKRASAGWRWLAGKV